MKTIRLSSPYSQDAVVRSECKQGDFNVSSTDAQPKDLQDPNGAYVKQWVPELAKLPKKYLHQPWLAPPEAQKAAGVDLGVTYPHRITGQTAMQVT